MEKTICAICAWRADCQKKFSVSGRDMRCPDFVRDLTIPEDKEEKAEETKKEKEKKKT
ncbi:MAG: hypothetical protein Q8N09_00820 [Thermodesulfovibrionia bacterium]|nr:hypothetical protein [Thermodesulfovibrionia bacterium]